MSLMLGGTEEVLHSQQNSFKRFEYHICAALTLFSLTLFSIILRATIAASAFSSFLFCLDVIDT